jgi:hypothetical protein
MAERIPGRTRDGAGRCPALERQAGVAFTGQNEMPITCLVLLIIALIAIPNFIKAVRKGNEEAAIRTLREIGAAEKEFREKDPDGDRHQDYATSLAELSHAGLIDGALAEGVVNGYLFRLSGGTHDWRCSATPLSGWRGKRNFIVCTDGVVRLSPSGPAACSSEAVE